MHPIDGIGLVPEACYSNGRGNNVRLLPRTKQHVPDFGSSDLSWYVLVLQILYKKSCVRHRYQNNVQKVSYQESPNKVRFPAECFLVQSFFPNIGREVVEGDRTTLEASVLPDKTFYKNDGTKKLRFLGHNIRPRTCIRLPRGIQSTGFVSSIVPPMVADIRCICCSW